MKKSAEITANMLPTWQVTLQDNPLGDSIVYFWRVRYQTVPGEDPLWSTSSFTHIPNSPTGWAQGHPGQFKRDGFERITQNETTRQWSFPDKKLKIELKTSGGNNDFNAPPYGILLNDNDLFKEPVNDPLSCAVNNNSGSADTRNRFLVVVLNPVTFKAITNIAPQFLCGNLQQFHTFPAMQLASAQNDLANFLTNSVPDGAYVAMISVNRIAYSTFTQPLKDAFVSLGATQITSAPDSSGYLLVARKGNYPFTPVEKTANPADTTNVKVQNVNAIVELTAPEMPGIVTSTVVGPAMEWGSLYHIIKEVQATDEVQLSVFTRSLTGQDSLYVADVNTASFALSGISAAQYPYLKLQLTLKDSVQFVPAQLKRWMVTYTPAPEGVARPDILGPGHYALTTPFDAGQTVSFRFKFHNISDVNFRDPVKAVVTINPGTQTQPDTVLVGNISPDSIAEFTYNVNTANLPEGDNSLLVYVNPKLQPEQYYTNNIMQASFKVRRDNLHPIIDVVFDGKHIMDGDIIAPDPTIIISMKDENRYRFKDDTVGVKVELVHKPDDGSAETRQQIQLVNNPDVQVQYASANSDFRVVYTPDYLPDGLYTLEVQGADKTGNVAGSAPYRISFRMVNASTITQFYPYPNPFSNSCRFVFTLTGQPELTKMKIQIITLTGKVVREITRQELGPLRIGRNITEFKWDGTDQ
ncbi:MAG: hypothetical protein EOP49_22025, partial [Sphingobacteriales bacterium]